MNWDAQIHSEMYLLVVRESTKATSCSALFRRHRLSHATLLQGSIIIAILNASSRSGKNQNTSHHLALTASPRHCLLTSPNLNGSLNSPPNTWEQNPDTNIINKHQKVCRNHSVELLTKVLYGTLSSQ